MQRDEEAKTMPAEIFVEFLPLEVVDHPAGNTGAIENNWNVPAGWNIGNELSVVLTNRAAVCLAPQWHEGKVSVVEGVEVVVCQCF